MAPYSSSFSRNTTGSGSLEGGGEGEWVRKEWE